MYLNLGVSLVIWKQYSEGSESSEFRFSNVRDLGCARTKYCHGKSWTKALAWMLLKSHVLIFVGHDSYLSELFISETWYVIEAFNLYILKKFCLICFLTKQLEAVEFVQGGTFLCTVMTHPIFYSSTTFAD